MKLMAMIMFHTNQTMNKVANYSKTLLPTLVPFFNFSHLLTDDSELANDKVVKWYNDKMAKW